MDSIFSSLLISYWLLLASTLFTSSGRACFVALTDSQGEFSPHLHPQVNLNIPRCTWRLEAPVGQVVEITFDEVEFDNRTDEDGNCIDSIKVFSGESSEIIPPFCGVGPPWPRLPTRLLSKTNILTVIMEKILDGSKGFRASYKHVPPRQEFIAFIAVQEPSIVHHNRLASRIPTQKIPLIGSSDPSALSFDPINKIFYFTDIHDKFIGRIGLDGIIVDKVITHNIENPLGVAVAYLTGLLYWTDADRHEVSVSRLDGSFRKTLMTSSSDCRTPKGIVVTPDNLNIFWTCESRIQKSKADGSNRNPSFVGVDVVDPTAITIDPNGIYVYWLDTHLGVVERIRVDGLGRIEALTSSSDFFTQLHSLVIDEFAYFFTNTNDQKLHFIERNAARPRSRTYTFIPPQTFRGLYYYKSDMFVPEQHVCATTNGGCNELCFPNEDFVTCIDVTPLIFNCPDDIVETSSSLFEAINWSEPTAVSRSSEQTSNVPYKFRSHSPMSVFVRGTTKVVYEFEDDLRNEAECAFNVTLQPISSTTFAPSTSNKVTKSLYLSSTTESQHSFNKILSTSEYIIIGLIILMVCLSVSIVAAALCCCGCCKCECPTKERQNRTDHSTPMSTCQVAPRTNMDQPFPMDSAVYFRAMPHATIDDDYITLGFRG